MKAVVLTATPCTSHGEVEWGAQQARGMWGTSTGFFHFGIFAPNFYA